VTFVRRAGVIACALAALAVAGCGGGGGGGGGGPDPAALVPAGAAVYADADVRDQGSGAESAASKLLATEDPAKRIAGWVDKALASGSAGGSPSPTYEADVKPWLGKTAAVFFTSFGDNPDGAFLIPTDDSGAALDAARKLQKADGNSSKSQSYKGVDYELTDESSPTAYGVVGGFLIAGSETGFKQVVDVSKGGSALADSSDYKDATGHAPGDRLATAYVEPKALFDALEKSGDVPAAARAQVQDKLGDAANKPAIADLDASADRVAFELSGGRPPAAIGAGEGENRLLTELPGDSWAAIGISNLGDRIGNVIKQVDAVPGIGSGGVEGQLQAQTGIDIRQVAKWVGDVALFGRGTDLQSIGGGAVAETTDQAASKGDVQLVSRAIARASHGQVKVTPLTLPGGGDGVTLQAQGFPIPIHFVERGDKVVFALGNDAAEQAFNPSAKLGDSKQFNRADAALGGGFDLGGYVSVPPILQLVENFGGGSAPGYQAARPYLSGLDFLAFGSSSQGDRQSAKVVLGLR
jgi:hypothetical protein